MGAYSVTVDDLKDRWPDFPAGAEQTASTLLRDATEIIEASLPTGVEASNAQVVIVACAMVKRVMAQATLPEGVTSVSQTVGPFATQMGFTANSGGLYVSRAEKKLLGIGGQRAGVIDLLGGP